MGDEILIRKALKGTLSTKEKVHFNEKMNNKSFQDHFALEQNIHTVIHKNEGQRLKKLLVQQEVFIQEKQKKQLRKKRLIGLLLALILLIGSLYFISNIHHANQIKTSESLPIAETFKPHPNTYQPTLRTFKKHDLRAHGFHCYDKKEYQQAINIWTQLPQSDLNDHIKLYLSNCYLATNQHLEQAAFLLNTITDENLKEEVLYYKAILLLFQDKHLLAIEALQQLANTDDPYLRVEINNFLLKGVKN